MFKESKLVQLNRKLRQFKERKIIEKNKNKFLLQKYFYK